MDQIPNTDTTRDVQPTAVEQEELSGDSALENHVRVPQYCRNIFPRNLSLSASDIEELRDIIDDANEKSKILEFSNLDLSKFENETEAKNQINNLIPVEYSYYAPNGDNLRGIGRFDAQDRKFPNSLSSFFISNSTFTERAINAKPLNCIDVYLDFKAPTLRIDLISLPSNATENKSVVNIYGRDEAWVISTSEKIQTFFKEKKSFRPVIHSSGVYDYFIFLIFIPMLLWIYTKDGSFVEKWSLEKSTLFNVVFGIYALLLSLLGARFLFQYARWLFPPVEYYKKSLLGARLHRYFATFVAIAILSGALYDIFKAIISIF